MNLKLIMCASLFSVVTAKAQVNLPKTFADVEKQTQVLLQEIPAVKKEQEIQVTKEAQATSTFKTGNDELVSPRTVENGKLKLVSSRDWTSGFFPGVLWYLYEYTGKANWKTEAEKYTALIEREKTNAGTHDMGFKIYCSFGNGYRLTNNPHYKDVIIQAAKTLATRFNPTAGVIKSWDNRKNWAYPVIIDNMMNLELLYAAAKLTGDSSSLYNTW